MVTIEGDVLARMIRAVLPAVSQDETRPHIAGVMLRASAGELVACATDGHRLHLATLRKSDLELDEVVLPVDDAARVSKILLKLEQPVVVQVRSVTRELIVEGSFGVCIARAAEVSFPPYRHVVPTQPEKGVSRLSCNPVYLAEALLAVQWSGRKIAKLKKGDRQRVVDENVLSFGTTDADVARVDATEPNRLFDFCAVVMPRRM